MLGRVCDFSTRNVESRLCGKPLNLGLMKIGSISSLWLSRKTDESTVYSILENLVLRASRRSRRRGSEKIGCALGLAQK